MKPCARTSLLIPAAFCITLIMAVPSRAATMSLGGQAWYAWWIPAWGNQDYTADPSITVAQSTDLERPDPEFMAGPMVSLGFLDRWSFSISGVYGDYSTRGVRRPAVSALIFEELDIRKYDVDSTLCFIVNQYLKLFAGFKLQGYDYDKILRQVREGNPPSYQWEQYKNTSYMSYGPGLGIGLSYPLGRGLYAVLNINALLLFATEETVLDKYVFNPAISVEHYAYGGTARLYGANGMLSLAYFIPESRLAVTAGFRYQRLRYLQDRSDVGEYNFDGKTEQFYGMVMSVIYSFNL